MNDKKERVYSEQDLCEYTILQKIEELERQLQGIKSEFNGLYETKEDANNNHSTLSNNIASVDSDLQVHIEENVRKFRDISTTINNMNNIIPNDIGIKDNKLGLKNGNTWLTNLNAMNLEGFTYDEATNTLKASGSGGSINIIELADKSGTIASAQLNKINANPQNFAFKYNGKILFLTSAYSTTYQYCNNTTSSSDNNVMTTSTLLTITSSTGAYTIAENVHNVVANSIHQANGGDLTNIQVGSKVYSIPAGGGATEPPKLYRHIISFMLGAKGTFKAFYYSLSKDTHIGDITTVRELVPFLSNIYGDGIYKFNLIGKINVSGNELLPLFLEYYKDDLHYCKLTCLNTNGTIPSSGQVDLATESLNVSEYVVK